MVKTVEVVRNKPIKQMQVEVENGKKLHEEKKKLKIPKILQMERKVCKTIDRQNEFFLQIIKTRKKCEVERIEQKGNFLEL
jgi:hypothetical protein